MSSAADPAIGAVAVVNDAVIVPKYCRALYVGTGGNISAQMSDGTTATFVGVQAGAVLPIRVKVVNASGTTASDILALY